MRIICPCRARQGDAQIIIGPPYVCTACGARGNTAQQFDEDALHGAIISCCRQSSDSRCKHCNGCPKHCLGRLYCRIQPSGLYGGRHVHIQPLRLVRKGFSAGFTNRRETRYSAISDRPGSNIVFPMPVVYRGIWMHGRRRIVGPDEKWQGSFLVSGPGEFLLSFSSQDGKFVLRKNGKEIFRVEGVAQGADTERRWTADAVSVAPCEITTCFYVE